MDEQKDKWGGDMLPVVQRYLGATLFKHTQHYELTTQQHAQYLDFNLHKIPLADPVPTSAPLTPLNALKVGYNSPALVQLQLVRLLLHGQAVICLAAEGISEGECRLTVLAVVCGNKEGAREWLKEAGFLGVLVVRNPFRAIHKVYTQIPFIITRRENVSVLQKYPPAHRTPEKLKNYANTRFKQKDYELALAVYEMGLGLITDPASKRDRAVLYANSCQCLFEMRLYQSALTYAEITVTLDRSYLKGYFRKMSCHLELSQFKEVPRLVDNIISTGLTKEAADAAMKFSRYMSNSVGVFDWPGMFEGAPHGEYYSTKLEFNKSMTKLTFIAGQKIHPYELIMVHKPLIYKRSEQNKFSEQYKTLAHQIGKYAVYEDLFFGKFIDLPNQCYLQGQPVAFKPNQNPHDIDENEIHSKCLRCLELEKNLQQVKAQQESMGIWEKLYMFQHKCLGNCTYLHIKGTLLVFALTQIEPNTTLSVDFLNWETANRAAFMRQKMGKQCTCTFCHIDWDCHEQDDEPEDVYELYQRNKERFREEGLDKINLFFLWELFFNRSFKENELIPEYLKMLERYPLWECVMNLFRYLRNRTKNHLFDPIKTTIKRVLEKFFKLTHEQAVALLKQIL